MDCYGLYPNGEEPSARAGHSATLMPNNTVYYVGGYNGDKRLNQVYGLSSAGTHMLHVLQCIEFESDDDLFKVMITRGICCAAQGLFLNGEL